MRFGKKITALISSIFPTVFLTTKTSNTNRYYIYIYYRYAIETRLSKV